MEGKRRRIMEIKKIINNNIVSSVDRDGRELVVMGRDIGFGKRPGQEIAEDSVEKIFRMDSKDSLERFEELLTDIPLEYVQLTNDIISYTKASIGIKLSQNVYLTLIDHISFAISRCKEGMHFVNALLEEIKLFYPKEYLVGKYALRLIEEKTGLKMPDDEAATIAMHLVNAEYNFKTSGTFQMTNMIQEMVERIEVKFPQFKENSMYKDWLVSNIKYISHRIMKLPAAQGTEDWEYQNMIRKHCEEEYSLVDEMNKFLIKKYDCSMTDEEKIYLAISIKRTRDIYRC